MIASQPNNVEVHWVMTNGTTNVIVYFVSSVPESRPARIFWTESPYDAPTVDLGGLFPVIHYNSEVPPVVYEVVTNVNGGFTNVTSNVVAGVWLDNQKQMHAIGVSGVFVLEYYQEGSYDEQVQPEGIEVVQVLEPEVQVLSVDIGSRLLPRDSYWARADGNEGVIPYVKVGLNDTAYLYAQQGPKYKWVFSIKRTVDEPWSLEIYWQHRGLMGVLWPYEVDWYSCDWPLHPQLLVFGTSTQDTPHVLVPQGLTATVMEYMDPPLHAKLSTSGRSFYTTGPGRCLLRYTTSDDIWFEVVQTVSHTNRAYFDLDPVDWWIGEELRPGPEEAHAMSFDGKDDYVTVGESWLNVRDDWTLTLWFDPGEARPGTLYAEGTETNTALEISITSNRALQVSLWNQYATDSWVRLTTEAGTVQTNTWQYLGVTLAAGSDSNGILRVYLDDQFWEQTNGHRVNFPGTEQALIAARMAAAGPTNFFAGRLDELRIWPQTLSRDEIWTNRYETLEDFQRRLIADYAFDEGEGVVIHNEAGDKNGTAINGPHWCYGQVIPGGDFASFPGYIYTPAGDRYNINRYNYPTESNPDTESYIFAVNTNMLEVWWANRSRQAGMPPVYYPSHVTRYHNLWPTNAPQIVIASGLGSQGAQLEPTPYALAFDGSTTYVEVSNTPVLNVEGAITVEAWVKLNTTNSQEIVAQADNADEWSGYLLGVIHGTLYPEIWDAASNYFACSAGSVPTGVWTHIAFTYETGKYFSAYVNGDRVYQAAAGEAAIRVSSSNLFIGRASWMDWYHVDGQIGEVRIWGVARSAAEIRNSMYSVLAGTEGGLIAYYRCQPGEKTWRLYDAGTNGLDGTIVGADWVAYGRPIPQTDPLVFGSPSIYYQNDPGLPGYNPNEEHALVLGDVVYALRNDLNADRYSRPFVLVDYLNPDSGRPCMQVFEVVASNLLYRFERETQAGLPILPPMPLAAMPLCTNSYSDDIPPAWRDRKLEWWARSAGDDGGTAEADMHFYYQMQPSFYFPALPANQQPTVGTEIPLLPNPSKIGGTAGTPIPVIYTISWPDDVPELKIAQTLTKPTHGLPDIWDQLSVEIIYEQSARTNAGSCVTLLDPVVDRGVGLDAAVVQAMVDSDLALRDLTSARVRFPGLPPSLYQRIFYDPDRGTNGELVIEGKYITPLVGDGYLLLNLLTEFERAQVRKVGESLDVSLRSKWINAVSQLPGDIVVIEPNTPYVHAALYAGLGRGVGYVTLAFNNSTNVHQVPPALPVSLSVIRVVPELYDGMLQAIEPEDPLAESLSLRASPDFAGRVEEYEFQWRWEEPQGGLIPNTNFPNWNVYGMDIMPATNEVTISGASPFTLGDHYFAMRYRKRDPDGPTGTNWSQWTYQFAPGWIQRVMDGINPFEQCMQDKIENAVDVRSTMISLAGPPYEGDIALNQQGACDAGLIPVYRTVLNRALDFSLGVGVRDESMNQALLYAASRLHDLYMLLGNEAYADALDPTIAFPNDVFTDEAGGEATGLFCFMNQVPNLLEEELGLLRGRDDTLEPAVTVGPVYNRLLWNFTQGINGGEAAYAYNYNLRGSPTSTVGIITAEDAKKLYPQGHGDAWGHYLSAIRVYYELLSDTNFVWHTTPGATLVGNATVSADFFDEQKFAEAAAARARTGVEIVDRTYRKHYSEAAENRWAGYRDSDTNRAWGLDGWASRAGQGALYDWAVANSLLLDQLTNMVQVGGEDRPPEGIEKIDRTTVPELREIAEGLRQVQVKMDNADMGLNPLGLAKGVVPFDISPTEIDAGKTHFEQIYDRALQALYNACIAFNYARNIHSQMRSQYDSLDELKAQLVESETEFHNRLIEIFGYPYPDDIGPGGTYPQGYDGPDLVNWAIIDLEDYLPNAPTGQPVNVELYNYVFIVSNEFESTGYQDYLTLPSSYSIQSNVVGTVTVYVAESGLQVKPPTWAGRRRALGELQLALGDVVRSWYALQAKIEDYNKTLHELEVELLHRQEDYERYTGEWQASHQNYERKMETSRIIEGLKITKDLVEVLVEGFVEGSRVWANGPVKSLEGVVGPFPYAVIQENLGFPVALVLYISTIAKYAVQHTFEEGIIGREGLQERWDYQLEHLLKGNEYREVLKWPTYETQVKLREQFVKQAELLEDAEALRQQVERVRRLLAEGQRLLVQRAQVRARASQRIQMVRYQDLSFRIFHHNALRRYKDTFDLAARYVYLAAKAYDYETGLLDSDTALTPGSRFLEDIVRARLPGRFYTWLGEPQVGMGEGEPGLADTMARMKADWNVVKGRFGFNNPDTETSRFSLRQELFRISPLASSDWKWAQVLENCKVDNLWALPEFKRYCIPFSDSTNTEPAIVIPFSTFVMAGKNYFGYDLAGGDNAYDPTHQATKIRSVGVWFTGYNITFNTNTTGGGLANEPRVYLIPIGEDVMRSPTREGLETRHWMVLDQSLPLPYNIGGADLDNPDYLPIVDSLTEPLCQIRRFASLRAYHDRGQFDEAETHNNARLVGRSVWNTQWLLIIPGRTLLADPEEGIERFIYGALVNGVRDGNGVKDIKIFFQTYSISGE